MTRCFFAITTNLGWRIIGDRLADALAAGPPAGHAFRAFTLPPALAQITRQPTHQTLNTPVQRAHE